MKKNNIDKWLSKQLADIKKANLHRTLVEISSSMGPEIKIGNKTKSENKLNKKSKARFIPELDHLLS